MRRPFFFAYLVRLLAAVSFASACTTDHDCSLNGHCGNDGRCECLSAWSGSSCAVLDLLPASRTAGLHSPASDGEEPTSSWGGSVAFDEASQKWVMLAAEMVSGCGIGAWETNSRIVRASSDTPGGTYTVDAEIKPPFAHEPVLARLPDGRFALYSIGRANSSDPPRTDCLNGYTPEGGGGGFRNAVPVDLMLSKNASTLLDFDPPIPIPVGDGDINPAPFIFPNGTTVMMWRGGDAWFHVHLARSSSYLKTPYTFNGTGTIFPGWDSHGIEDPFVYAQPDPWVSTASAKAVTYHAIFHDHKTFGGHAFSEDGVSWTYSPTVPFTNQVLFDDNTTVSLQRRERPHLIFDSDGYISHLTNGVQPPPNAFPGKAPPSKGFQNDFTYTMVQPVRRQAAVPPRQHTSSL